MGRWFVVLLWGVVAAVAGACSGDGDSTSSLTADTSDEREGLDGLWLLSSVEIGDEPIPTEAALFLEIDGTEINGDTTCNHFGGELGGQLAQTAKECLREDVTEPDPMAVERAMLAAIRAGPGLDGQQLVFTVGGVRLVYDAVADPAPADLYAALDDETLLADVREIFLDPEAGGHPDYQRLVRLGHPSSDARFYLGTEGEVVCFVVSTHNASLTVCQLPRYAVRSAVAYDLANRHGPVGVRVALIPDAFVDAATQRPDLGEIGANVLLVSPNAEAGRHVLRDAAGEEFVLDLSK